MNNLLFIIRIIKDITLLILGHFENLCLKKYAEYSPSCHILLLYMYMNKDYGWLIMLTSIYNL